MHFKRLGRLEAPKFFFIRHTVFAQPIIPQNITDEECPARAMMTPDQVLYFGVLRRIVSVEKDMVAAPIIKAP